MPRPEFNHQLLTRLAEATGGEVNPRSVESQAKTSITKTYQPVKQPLIILALSLFFLEIVLRKLAYSEPD
jgi:hypothetical protein